MFFSLRHNLEDLVEKAEEVKSETNRAAIATAGGRLSVHTTFEPHKLSSLRIVYPISLSHHVQKNTT